jgi:hypothetical protein
MAGLPRTGLVITGHPRAHGHYTTTPAEHQAFRDARQLKAVGR